MSNSQTMHAFCMCAVADVNFKELPTLIYSDRVTDLQKAIDSRKLEVTNFIKLSGTFDAIEKKYKLPVLTKEYYNKFRSKGSAMGVKTA